MEQEIITIDLEGVNCYLLKRKNNFILVDTGGHMTLDKEFTNRREKLVHKLEKEGCIPGNLLLVVLTHGDSDHTANAAFIRDKYGVKLAMHSRDLELVENLNIEKAMSSFCYKSLLYKIIFAVMNKLIRKISLKIIDDFEKFTPDIYIDDGYSLREYGFDGKIIHMPGHTEGSIGILMSNGELIAGDTFANMKKPDIALNANNFKLLEKSINSLRKLDIKMIYPGHGEPFKTKELKKF